mgnify:CR=1 FL=1
MWFEFIWKGIGNIISWIFTMRYQWREEQFFGGDVDDKKPLNRGWKRKIDDADDGFTRVEFFKSHHGGFEGIVADNSS